MFFAFAQEPVIVLIEDDAGHAILIQQHLRVSGGIDRIEHFSSGQAGLDFFLGDGRRAEEGRGYIVLLDLRLPDIDGREVLRRLQAHARLRPMPIIILSASGNEPDVAQCYAMGCHGYVQKPVDHAAFGETMQRLGRFLALIEVPAMGARSRAWKGGKTGGGPGLESESESTGPEDCGPAGICTEDYRRPAFHFPACGHEARATPDPR